MILPRKLRKRLQNNAGKFPVLAILGPRQSGKSTLAKIAFPDHKYLSLEDLRLREFAQSDPMAFLEGHENQHGIILDEVQWVPALFSCIQVLADRDDRVGYFVLTGSQNFLQNEAITQSLAGRVALHTLLPFSYDELAESSRAPRLLDDVLFAGLYPRLYARDMLPEEWYPNYIRTYIERDVRQLKNVVDISTFQRFVRLCAGRIGQVVNLTSLANDCGISVPTVRSWLSVLEASYIIFLLQPYHKNFSKRLIKSPKIYFYDPGLVCSLLGIEKPEQLRTHYLRGGIFETFVISELYKLSYNEGREPHYYFWRDRQGREIDCLIEQAERLVPIEIKVGQNISQEYFTSLKYFGELADISPENRFVVYGGEEDQKRSSGKAVSWKHLEDNLRY